MKRSPLISTGSSDIKTKSLTPETEIDSIASRILQVASSERHQSGSVPVPINVVLSPERHQQPEVESLRNSIKGESSERLEKTVKNTFNNTPNTGDKKSENVNNEKDNRLKDKDNNENIKRKSERSLIIDLQITR